MTPLTRAQRRLATATGLAGTALAALGGYESYGAVEQVAAAHHFAHPRLFPLGVDTAVVALFLAELLLAWLDMPWPPLRWGAWALVGATTWWNAAASTGNLLGMAMHATAPLLVVVWIESIRHAVRVRARMAARRHIERGPLARWLLAPAATFRMWRAQCLWNVTSYTEAIALDRRRLLAKARLRERYGWTRHGLFWWLLTPASERVALRVVGPQEPPAGTDPAVAPSPNGSRHRPPVPPEFARTFAVAPPRPAPATATAVARARKPKGARAKAGRGDRTQRARQWLQQQRASGQPRPETAVLVGEVVRRFGLARSSRLYDLANTEWPAPAEPATEPGTEGAA